MGPKVVWMPPYSPVTSGNHQCSQTTVNDCTGLLPIRRPCIKLPALNVICEIDVGAHFDNWKIQCLYKSINKNKNLLDECIIIVFRYYYWYKQNSNVSFGHFMARLWPINIVMVVVF